MTDENPRSTGRLRISQETIATLTVGVALAGLILITTGDLRNEARADRSAWQTQSQQMRNEWQAESQQMRNEWQAESRQLRDEARAHREAFQREILRLTQAQAELGAIVASTRPTNE